MTSPFSKAERIPEQQGQPTIANAKLHPFWTVHATCRQNIKSSHPRISPCTTLLPHCLSSLPNNLNKLPICLDKLVIAFRSLLARPLLADHDHARGPLRRTGLAELRARPDVDVRHVVVFAENGDVRDDVHGRDIGGDDDDGRGVSERGVRGFGFAQRFYDFFYAAAERLGFGGWGMLVRDKSVGSAWTYTS
jgi:hypothetical protein